MQKIVTIRASQGALDEALTKFTEAGWNVKSVTKGSEWSRIGFSYKWTVVLECDDATANTQDFQEIKNDIQISSAIKNIIFIIGAILVAILVTIIILTL